MEINQYPLESFAFQDEDYYDIDFWTGSGYQTKKILGSVIKAGILAAVENIYNTDGTLTGSRAVNIDGSILSFISNNAGEFEVILDNGSSEFSKFSQTLAQIFLQIQGSIPTNQMNFDLNPINTQLTINDGVNYASLQVSGVGSALNFTDGLTNYRIEANENGVIVNTSYTLPNTDGTNGQVMTTNGAGVVSWQDAPTPSTVDSAKREVVEFINKTGAPILEGTIVYLKTSSSSGTHPEVELADASTEATSSKTIGAIYETTANDAIGLIVTSGEVDNLDTSMYSVGDRLWLSTTAGQVTTTPPVSPDHLVFIGIVTRAQNGNGRILYSIQNGYELNELHDVSVPSPNNGDVLTFNSVSGLWEASVGGGANVYNTNGTLSADRVMTMNNFGLTFDGLTGSNGSQLNLTASAANRSKALNFKVGSGLRWKERVSGTELGGDDGSVLAFDYYSDAGTFKGTALQLNRTDGSLRLNSAYNLPTSAGTNGQVMRVNGSGNVTFQSLPAEIQLACSDEISAITAGAGKLTFRMPYGMTLTGVRASLTTAQTSGSIFTVDIGVNGVSALATKLTIDNTEKTSTTATTPAVITTSAFFDDAEIRIDVTQIGDGTAKGLKVTLLGTRS